MVVLGEPFGVADSEVLHAVAVVDQPVEGQAGPVPSQIACSRALSARSVFNDREACQPTMRRENMSVMSDT